MINISVLIMTLNEADNLPRCLAALQDFDEIIIVDSGSDDGTNDVARSFGVRVENFNWNGDYPKKRQWCLDHIEIKHDYIFFVDADEEVTPELIDEIKNLDFQAAGYFVKGQYVFDGKILKHGLRNNKLVLFDRHKIEFPVVDDLDIDGMGEIEGHYQPVLKDGCKNEKLLQLTAPLLHFAYEDDEEWQKRHQRYAVWEAEMIRRRAYPEDPDKGRQKLKEFFQKIPCRGLVAFVHSYILKLGFLDGVAGYRFACSRAAYYRMVSNALAANKGPALFCEAYKQNSAP